MGSADIKIAVIGGGVAGMSAAHELAERGFSVEVFERNTQYVGGKARSVNVPDTNTQFADKYLPGEHGFRFFPGFYKHVTDTMKRTPYPSPDRAENREGCLDNLTPVDSVMIARDGKPAIVTVANFPRSLHDIELLIRDMHQVPDLDLKENEIQFFAERMWQLMTSCTERRDQDYERLSWWDYLDADHFKNPAYRSLLVAGLTRTLVAAQARYASTKTGGNTLLQLLFTMMSPGKANDRVLDGPTNDRWLNPWLAYLESLGVEYHFGTRATSISMDNGRIATVEVADENGETRTVTADHFILAVPVERAAPLVTVDMEKADSTLASLKELAGDVSWMNGIQYYLNEDVRINRGHIIFSDSQWALTGISQPQFWPDYEFGDRFNGKVKGLLSVDISDWLHTEYKGSLAEDLPADQVAKFVWEQILEALNVDGETVLRDDMLEHWYLDRDIRWNPPENKDEDMEPLLVNKVNTWALRPEAVTRIPNLYLASDYVRTNTDLATMEGANEAARRAVNGIIAATGSNDALCRIWSLEEPMFFAPLRWLDRRRFRVGQEWSGELPWWMKVVMVPWGLAFSALFAVRSLLSFLRR